MKKVLIAVLALGFMAATSGLVLADGSTPATGKKHRPHHHPKTKKTTPKKVDSTAPAPAPTK